MAAALILALPRVAVTNRFLRFRLGRWLGPRTTSRRLRRRPGRSSRPAGLSAPPPTTCFSAPSVSASGSAGAALSLRRTAAAAPPIGRGDPDRSRSRGADRGRHQHPAGAHRRCHRRRTWCFLQASRSSSSRSPGIPAWHSWRLGLRPESPNSATLIIGRAGMPALPVHVSCGSSYETVTSLLRATILPLVILGAFGSAVSKCSSRIH